MPPRAARPVSTSRCGVVKSCAACSMVACKAKDELAVEGCRGGWGLGAGGWGQNQSYQGYVDFRYTCSTENPPAHNPLFSNNYRPTTALRGEFTFGAPDGTRISTFCSKGHHDRLRVSSTSPASALRREGNPEFTEGRPKRSASLQTLRTHYRPSLKVTKSENLSTTN